mmetsp:Transcript_33673/g.82622  ORF Transcript_33673/g.82622 Transcript_33673/m.82622 type:complete len:223 (+) Transcript_33673:63-731(+)
MAGAAGDAPKLEVMYFKIANRGGALRDALRWGGVAFENTHVEFADFKTKKEAGEFPLGSLPVLVVDGEAHCESIALTLYAAQLAGIAPAGALDALKVNEILCAVEDAQVAFTPVMRGTYASDDEKHAARLASVSEGGAVYKYLAFLEKRAAANAANKPYAVGASMTVADFRLRHIANWMNSGMLDGIPEGHFAKQFPTLAANAAAVNDLIKAKCGDDAVSGK